MTVGFTSDDPGFRDRFSARFHDCVVPVSESQGNAVWLDVTTTRDSVSARFFGPSRSVDELIEILHPELKRIDNEASTEDAAKRYAMMVNGQLENCLMTEGPHITISKRVPWQMMLTRILLADLMRLQPGLVFLHGATVAIDSAGVLLTGEKGSGKSTLSLGLAARGHGFLGDEVAAVNPETREMYPIRMQVSIREGMQAREVTRFIDDQRVKARPYLDGSSRFCAQVSSMFPNAMAPPVPLTDVFFLGPMADMPKIKGFQFGMQDLGMVAPLHGTLAATSYTSRLFSFMRLFGSVRCHLLSPGGTPERTVAAIEETVKGAGAWATA